MRLNELLKLYRQGKYNLLSNIFAGCGDVFLNYFFLLIIMRDYGRTGDMKLLRLGSLIYTEFRDHGDGAFLVGLKDCPPDKIKSRTNKYFTFVTEVDYIKYYMTAFNFGQFLDFLPKSLHEWFVIRVDIAEVF